LKNSNFVACYLDIVGPPPFFNLTNEYTCKEIILSKKIQVLFFVNANNFLGKR
jgi:hypothetical protein